jgi:hypothetical protein
MGLASMVALSHERFEQRGVIRAKAAAGEAGTSGGGSESTTTTDESTDKAVKSAAEKITAFIPSDVVGIYIAGLGFFAPESLRGKWWIFGIAAGLVPIFLLISYFAEKKRDKQRTDGDAQRRVVDYLLLALFAEIAFVCWAAAFPGSPFLSLIPSATKIAAFGMIVLAAVMPPIAAICDLVPIKN